MATVDNLKEGFRRMWIVLTVLATIGHEIFMMCVISHIIKITKEPPHGYILLAILTGFLVFCILYFFGWQLFVWIFNGFAGIKPGVKQENINDKTLN